MGTHPIFESDFDCLTDRFRLRIGTRIQVRTGTIYKPGESGTAVERENRLFATVRKYNLKSIEHI